MPTDSGWLYLFEALELRSEYDARMKTIKECLPETRSEREHRFFSRDEDSVRRPGVGLDPAVERERLKKLEFKRRKLNAAIQQTNFARTVEFRGDAVNLNEALELRKALNTRIAELHTQTAASAYERVIYKEGRDIVEKSGVDYVGCERKLNESRVMFRDLNRILRRATFEAVVNYKDE